MCPLALAAAAVAALLGPLAASPARAQDASPPPPASDPPASDPPAPPDPPRTPALADRPLAAVLEDLDAGDAATRAAALRELAGRGAAGRPALGAIASRLADDADPAVRLEAARAIGALAARRGGPRSLLPRPTSIDSALAARLTGTLGHAGTRDASIAVRAAAAAALASLDAPEEARAWALERVLFESDAREAQRAAAHGLLAAGRPGLLVLVKPFSYQVAHDDEVRDAACEALAKAEPGHIRAYARAYLAQHARKLIGDDPLEKDEVDLDQLYADAMLERLGPQLAPTVLRTVHEEGPLIRELGLAALANAGPEIEPAVPSILPLLADEDPDLRAITAEALSQVARYASAAAPALARALGDADPRVRHHALAALERMGPGAAPAAPALVGLVVRGEGHEATRAVAALGHMGAAAVPALVAALEAKDGAAAPDARTRERLAGTLEAIGPGAATAAEALGRLLVDDPALEVRQTAARALNALGEGALPARSALERAFGDAALGCQPQAAAALAALGAGGLPRLLAGLESESLLDRLLAATALAEMHPRALAGALPALEVAVAEDPSFDVRAAAARALGRLGPLAAPAAAALGRALGSFHEDLRAEAIAALGGMGAAAVPATIEALGRGERDRFGALEALQQLGEAGHPAAAAATQLLSAEAAALRAQAARALGAIGPRAGSAAEALAARLDDPSPEVRDEAARALVQLKSAAVRPLERALSQPAASTAARRLAVRALGGLGGYAFGAQEAVALALSDDPDVETRAEAARALGAMAAGTAPTNDVTAIVRALADAAAEDADPRVRDEARRALARVRQR